MSILEVTNLKKVYTTRFGTNKVEALKNVNFCVEEGEFVAIMGESGSGKTTLLNILAALDKPTAGGVLLDGRDFSKLKEHESATFRRDNLGFVFQDFNLLDTLTLEDNIFLPLVLAGNSYKEMKTLFAALHLVFAFPMIWKILRLFGLSNQIYAISITAIAFAVFAVLYAVIYKLTARSYFKIVASEE